MKRFSSGSRQLQGSVYSRLVGQLGSLGPVIPLHVGDTWMEPPEGCRLGDLRVEDHPGMHRYTRVRGYPPLVEALAALEAERTGLAARKEEVLVGAGATGCLAALVGAVVEPGRNVVILAPYWPLIAGMVRLFGGEVRALPLDGLTSADEAAAALARTIDADTVAVYWNTPNNPTGRHLPPSWLRAMVEVCRAHDIGILADEVYEHYVYRGVHTPSRPLAPERTAVVRSFSKTYGMAGNRVGWAVGPEAWIEQARRVSTHLVYGAPTGCQVAALQALQEPGQRWVEQARAAYAELGREAAERLGVEPPDGGTFLFLDVGAALDTAGLGGFLERAARRGVLLAPGPSFGPYPHHVRLCFTSAPPERVRAGVAICAELLDR